MKRLILILLVSCGPTVKQLTETPIALTPVRHTEAPPASVDDELRHELVQTFDDMRDTQQAYREADQTLRETGEPIPTFEPEPEAPIPLPTLRAP